LNPEDKEIIKKYEAVEAARIIKKQELEVEAAKELERHSKLIEEARKQYESIPSILEREVIKEPAYDPQLEDTQQWWERFYLKADPFPIKEGLQKIDEDLYEEIIVKTKPFQDVLDALNKNPAHLFHSGFLLVGGYGYGKTTFIDYLMYHLVQKDILPILVLSGPVTRPDSSSYANHFHLNLRDRLKEQLLKISTERISDIADLDVIGQIKELVRCIQKHRRHGVVVFLDDYHKHESTYEYIYEFLGLQQILKNDLMRDDLNVGFIVSGLPEWDERLSKSGQLRGFLDNTPIVMPEITRELVCDVFNQRIKAYCFDESPRKIKPQFVEDMFKEVPARLGYRDYLGRIIEELSSNNFAIIDAPIEIDRATLDIVKAEVERDDFVKSALHKLVYGSKFESYTKEQISKCLSLLVQTSMHDGITEADKLFLENKFHFKRLHDVGLIQKGQSINPEAQDSFEWVIHSRLQKTIDTIEAKFKLGITHYLLKLYGGKDYGAPPPTITLSSELVEVARFFSRDDLKIPKSALDNMNMALRLFESVTSRNSVHPKPDEIERAWSAFTALSNAFFEIDGSKSLFNQANISDLKDQWSFHWSVDEVVSELLNRYHDYISKSRGNDKSISGTLVIKQLQEVFPIIADRLKAATEDISEKTFHGLYSRNVQHSTDELAIFDQAREGYASAINVEHYNYVKRITDYLEIRMRMFLYATSVLILGDNYEVHIPPALHKYAMKNLEFRARNSVFRNPYAGLTRSQLQTIFVDGNKIKETICRYLNCGWTDADWQNFFRTFVVENIATGHQQHEAFSHLDKNQYMNYCRRAEELTCAINVFIRNILRNNSYMILCGDQAADLADYLFCFTLREVNRDGVSGRVFRYDAPPRPLTNVHQSTLSEGAYATVSNSLKHKIDGSLRNCLVEDLLNVEYLTNNYNVTYLEFFQSLAFAFWVDKKIVIQQWFGSSIVIKQAA
jgi:hypothetical protein